MNCTSRTPRTTHSLRPQHPTALARLIVSSMLVAVSVSCATSPPSPSSDISAPPLAAPTPTPTLAPAASTAPSNTPATPSNTPEAADYAGAEDDVGKAEGAEEPDDAESTRSPILAALGIEFGEYDYAKEFRDSQLLIQECMAGKGFEYTPIPFDDPTRSGDSADESQNDSSPELAIERGTREWAEKYGYGISTFPDTELEYTWNVFFGGPEPTPDPYLQPNRAYRDTLGPEEGRAWGNARWGDPASPEDVGCSQIRVPPTGDYLLLYTFDVEFAALTGESEKQVNEDPRVTSLGDEWVQCMSDNGFPDQVRGDARIKFREEMQVLNDELLDAFAVVPTLVGNSRLDRMNLAEIETWIEQNAPELDPLIPTRRAKQADITDREIAVAIADWDCSSTEDAVIRQVRHEYEQRFVDQNQAAIAAFLERQR